MSTTLFAERVQAHQSRRAVTHAERATQVAALYPHARTFVLDEVTHLGKPGIQAEALERLPKSLTLVTPDHDDPGQDQLFVGPHPVSATGTHYDAAFQELTFNAHGAGGAIHGNLRLTDSRTRAFGVLEFGGEAYSVTYVVKPQRFLMRVGKDAGYLAGSSTMPELKWDAGSDRWKNAAWTPAPTLAFTYGVDVENPIGDEQVWTFVASFDEPGTERRWQPDAGFYSGVLNARLILDFGVMPGVTPPPTGSGGGTPFPFRLRAQMSEFGDHFEGVMLTDSPNLQGTVYGVQGTWAAGNIAGLYHLGDGAEGATAMVGVHDGRLFLGDRPVDSHIEGDTLRWSNLDASLAQASGLPEAGYLTFSSDGRSIVGSSAGQVGVRVSHHEATLLASAGTADAHGLTLAASDPSPDHTLTALLAMSQFAQSETKQYYDRFQSQSMEDFYAILQEYMDPDQRKQFFNPNPTPLDAELRAIAEMPGAGGEDAKTWYRSLSTAYTVGALSTWSSDPGSALLNGVRANAWISRQTAVSPVMLAQAPRLYARRYQQKFTGLGWFLTDQQVNQTKYATYIDAKAADWIRQMEASATGTAEEIAKLRDEINLLRDTAKKKNLYWAFAVYTQTTSPSYLNMLQTIVAGGSEIDGSEFTQRVQRTTALLGVLDPSGFFAQQYAYVLQLFQVASLLPQFLDYGADIPHFSYAVKQIVDAFIAKYIDSSDPKMREAAEALRKQGTEALVGDILQLLRQATIASGGLHNWTLLVAEFQSTAARVFGHLPDIVWKTVALGAVSLMIMFFIEGRIHWDDIPLQEKVIIIANAAGILATIVKMIVIRGVAMSELWVSANGLWSNLRMFFSPSLLTKAETSMARGFKGWLLQSVEGLDDTMQAMRLQHLFADAAEAAALEAEMSRMTTIGKIFGRNLNEFLATRIGAVLAALGIVMSAFLLAQAKDPLDIAANSLFLAASCLEFIATAGLWATQALGIATIGGLAVGSIFAIVSVVGVVAMLAGAILIAILLFRPHDTPLQTFAKEKAGPYYMPYKTAIDYFRQYQPPGEQQRSGVCLTPNGDKARSLYLGSDRTLSQKPFDGTGHTALYLNVDAEGRAQFGAPIVDDEGNHTMLVVALDDKGTLVAAPATATTTSDATMQWRAEIQGEGTHVTDAEGNTQLSSAPFRFYNEHWHVTKGVKRYLAASNTGWTAVDGQGTTVTIEMVSAKPQLLRMQDVSWLTVEHDRVVRPALGIPGSAPRKWKVTPDLPAGLVFSADTGAVAMKTGVDVAATPKATYTLDVDNTVGQASTTFTLEVLVPPVVVAS